MNKKIASEIAIGIILVLAVVVGAIFWLQGKKEMQMPEIKNWKQLIKKDKQIVGNDSDVHGCIGSAGYSWCAEKQKCLREWEEECEQNGSANEFCGTSTRKVCESNEDCVKTGCSGQICSSTIEKESIGKILSTCEYKSCYDSQKAGVSCGCIKNKCQWFKK